MGMDGIIWAGEKLLEITHRFLETTQAKREMKRDDSDRFADYLDHIANCVHAIATGITSAQPLDEKCAEFKVYLQDFEDRMAKVTDKDTARHLTFWLYRVEAVPRYAMADFDRVLSPPTTASLSESKRQDFGRQISGIAARMRAMANKLRA